ncbi:hypothetical protein ACNKHL_07455 [Shigella flexneri]
MAVAESGMGIVKDKVIKNHFASEYIYNAYKDEKTCGVITENDTFGTITIAEPIGIICGIVRPLTRLQLLSPNRNGLKTRNAIIFSPHPRAKMPPTKRLISFCRLLSLPVLRRSNRLDRSTFC